MSSDLRFSTSSPGKRILIVLIQVLFICYSIVIFYPLFNMIMSSFKTTREILRFPFALPKSFSLANYKTVLIDRGFARFFFNSLWMTTVTMAFVLLFGSMGAYGVSRYVYKLRTSIYLIFLSGIMLPLKAAIIPLFILMKKLDFINKPISVILVFIAMSLPSTIFILSGFMKSIPKDLEYAARIDGCNDWMIYRHVVMPVVTPAIALVTIYNSVPVWNDFFFPLVFLQNPVYKTLPLGLTGFFGQYSTDWSLLFTALTLAILPMLILYTFMAKYFIKGMTAGAVK